MIKNNPVALVPSVCLYGKLSSGNKFSIKSDVSGIDALFSMSYSGRMDNLASYISTNNWEES